MYPSFLRRYPATFLSRASRFGHVRCSWTGHHTNMYTTEVNGGNIVTQQQSVYFTREGPSPHPLYYNHMSASRNPSPQPQNRMQAIELA
jgi:hypothetical protein